MLLPGLGWLQLLLLVGFLLCSVLTPVLTGSRVDSSLCSTPHPAALQQHGVNPDPGCTAVCVPAWCGVCVMLAGGRCVSASAHHRDIAHRDLLSTELSWALVRWRAWVRGAQAAGPVSSPPTLHTPAPTSHQPAETGRKSGDLWKWPVF